MGVVKISLGDSRSVLRMLLGRGVIDGRVRVPRFSEVSSFFEKKKRGVANEVNSKTCTSCKGDPRALSNFYFKKTENRYEAICLDCKKKKVLARKKKKNINQKNSSNTFKEGSGCFFVNVLERFDDGFSKHELSLRELVSDLLS